MDGTSTTRLQIGGIAARCPRCGKSEFLARPEGQIELVCAACRTPSSRRALVEQIAREAIERAEALLRSRRKPP